MSSPNIKVLRKNKGFVEDRGAYIDYIEIRATAVSDIHISLGGMYINISKQEKEMLKKSQKIEDLKNFDFDIETNMLPYDGNNFIIPGTSVKGAVRFRAEMMFKSINGESPSCYIVYKFEGKQNINYISIWGSQVLEKRSSCMVNPRKERYNICEVCDIFGAPGAVAKVSFSNLVPVDDNFVPSYVKVFDEEIPVFPAGTVFEGRIYYNSRQLELYQLGLLLRAMRVPERKPILIGKYKYRYKQIGRPFGLLRFEVTGSSDNNFSVDEAVKAFDDSWLGRIYYRWDLNETSFLGY